jgi:hypothetical protein
MGQLQQQLQQQVCQQQCQPCHHCRLGSAAAAAASRSRARLSGSMRPTATHIARLHPHLRPCSAAA